MAYLALLSGAASSGMEGGGTPVGGAPRTSLPRHSPGALRQELATHLGRVELLLDDQVNDLLAPLVYKLLTLVSNGPWHVAAQELDLIKAKLNIILSNNPTLTILSTSSIVLGFVR